MSESTVVTVTPDGLRCDGRPWEPRGAWVGAVELDVRDRRAGLLAVAAKARAEELAVIGVDAAGGNREAVLSQLAASPPRMRPRGLLLGAAWQEIVAARCSALAGAAADLGLADAVRIDDDGGWKGHHVVAGAVEAFLAQIWPESAGAPPRAVVLGEGPLAMVAALAAARRGAAAVTVIAVTPAGHDELTARFAAADWPATATWQVSARLDSESPPSGVWLRTTDAVVDDAAWLPDAAGEAPCVLVDLEGTTPRPPLGFAHPDAAGVQVMAAGLAAAWYLGPPVPWDALTAAGD